MGIYAAPVIIIELKPEHNWRVLANKIEGDLTQGRGTQGTSATQHLVFAAREYGAMAISVKTFFIVFLVKKIHIYQ
jgi:hypothetical protein